MKTVKMGGRKLHVQTFKSNQPAELQAFVAKAYTTILPPGRSCTRRCWPALISSARCRPRNPGSWWSFPTGRTNSSVKREDVLKAAQKLGLFNAFAIDYMEGPKNRQIPDQVCQPEPRADLEGRVGVEPRLHLPERSLDNAVLLRRQLRVTAHGKLRPGQPDDRRDQDHRCLADARAYLLRQRVKRDSPQYVRFAGPGKQQASIEQKFTRYTRKVLSGAEYRRQTADR